MDIPIIENIDVHTYTQMDASMDLQTDVHIDAHMDIYMGAYIVVHIGVHYIWIHTNSQEETYMNVRKGRYKDVPTDKHMDT